MILLMQEDVRNVLYSRARSMAPAEASGEGTGSTQGRPPGFWSQEYKGSKAHDTRLKIRYEQHMKWFELQRAAQLLLALQ